MRDKIRKILKKHSIKEDYKSPYNSEVYLSKYVLYDRYFNDVIEDMFKLFNNELEKRPGTIKITENLRNQLRRINYERERSKV